MSPKNLGVIGNGHFIKLSTESDEPWFDQNFENIFNQADSNFTNIIEWLSSLAYTPKIGELTHDRFLAQPISEAIFRNLIECITSLAIRSPMTRASCIAMAESVRFEIPTREKNAIIALNMRDMFQRAIQVFGVRGKLAVLYSPDREFIFGDGFFHNLGSPSCAPSRPEILVPVTPRIAVLYCIPIQYRSEPRLCTLVIDTKEAQVLNNTVQIYAANSIFFRTDRPDILPEFQSGIHRRYCLSNNPVSRIINSMPGIPERDTSLDFLEEMTLRRRYKDDLV